MSSDNLAGDAATSDFDHLMIQSLMSRLQLRAPYLDTNSFHSQNLDDFLLGSDSDPDLDPEPESDSDAKHRKMIAREESRLEKEIIRIINAGSGKETLKPNSGQSVSIGDHNICVGVHDERGSNHRVWEWHGHIMFFDEEDGYSAEYVYGNYFERVIKKKEGKNAVAEEEEEEDVSKVKGEGNSGLRDLIGGDKGRAGAGLGRVIHRNSLNPGSAASTK